MECQYPISLLIQKYPCPLKVIGIYQLNSESFIPGLRSIRGFFLTSDFRSVYTHIIRAICPSYSKVCLCVDRCHGDTDRHSENAFFSEFSIFYAISFQK